MAKGEATLLLKIKLLGEKSLKAAQKGLAGLKKGAQFAAQAALGIGVVSAALLKLGKDAAVFKSVQQAFRNMAQNQGQDADQMLNKMRELSAGTVSDLKLMQQANNALLLGLPVDRFGDMLNIARSSAKATGQTMEFMLSSIVTGLGRGSKLVLDNLGIVFDVNKAYEDWAVTLGKTAAQLTDAERKTAFINKALEIGNKNAKAAGAGAKDLNERWQSLVASGENLAITIGKAVGPGLDFFLTKMDGVISKTEEFSKTNFASQIFEGITVGATLAGRAVNVLGDILGATLGTTVGAITQMMEGRFLSAWTTVKEGFDDFGSIFKSNLTALQTDITTIEQKFQDQRELNQTKALSKRIKNIKKHQDEEKKIREKALIFVESMNTKELQGRQAVLSQISTLQNANNKAFVVAGKLAAIANIKINTARGMGMALGHFPPPLSFIMAGAVAAAGAHQIAQVVGVQLAEGGIVQARPGGTQATIGEAGQDEAVIPLDDDEATSRLGANITVVVNGGLLGDETSARELAMALDQEFLKLRQNNESESFSGII